MKFSVVVPLYNKANYVEESLRAVLAQTCGDFEVIVIDDGSTDDGPARVEAIPDSRIRLIRQANGGVSSARNAGIAAASGEWIAFLDADDLWSPDLLRIHMRSIAENPSVDVVGTDLMEFTDAAAWSRTLPSAESVPPAVIITDVPTRWLQGSFFFTSSVAVRRARLLQMKTWFPVGESQGEDVDLWLRLGEAGPLAVVPANLVGYRAAESTNLTRSHRTDLIPPYLGRVRQRALSGAMPAALRASSIRFVNEQQINLVRACMGKGDIRGAIGLLMNMRAEGIFYRRWWVSLAMLALPPRYTHAWQEWRFKRRNARRLGIKPAKN